MNQEQLRYEWKYTPWRKLERVVFKLQKRIYQASKRGNVKAVHRLQRLLAKSKSAKYLAVRKVTQDNRGKKTAGVDGVKSLTPEERLRLSEELKIGSKAKATKRVWIPKPGKLEKRPLGIPTMKDRATQALLKLILEPEWEAKFEVNSYGFRPGRSAHDAIEAIFNAIRYQDKYVLDADIEKCFDKINHQYLLNKLNTSTVIRKQIKAWLKAGVLDNDIFYTTHEGTPQGGVISPLLANIALHGLENEIKSKAYLEFKGVRKEFWANLQIIRYADDFVVLHQELKVVQRCKALIQEWLKAIGLNLKSEKTRICHTIHSLNGETPGFKFLGFHIRQYKVGKHHSGRNTRGRLLGFKTLIKPSKESIKNHAKSLRDHLKALKGANQKAVISKLNPIIKGWARYYSSAVSTDAYEWLDNLIHYKIWKWAKFNHAHKGSGWIKKKYFRTHGNFNWRFMTPEGEFLIRHQDHKITRHIKVQGDKSPYDGDLIYWSTRKGKHPLCPPRVSTLLKEQKGKCGKCNLYFKPDDIVELHHKDGNHNNNKHENLTLLHGHCHDTIHGVGMYDKHQVIEEPDELKGSCPVLKPSMEGDLHA